MNRSCFASTAGQRSIHAAAAGAVQGSSSLWNRADLTCSTAEGLTAGCDAAAGAHPYLRLTVRFGEASGPWELLVSGRGTEDDVAQALSPRSRFALAGKLRPPCGAKVVTHSCRLRQRRVGVQSLKTTIHLNVHAVLISALPDVRFGVLFFAPSTPAAESATHRTER